MKDKDVELRRTQQKLQEAEWKLQQLLGEHFGPSSEKIHPDQLELLLEGIEAAEPEEVSRGQEPAPKPRKKYRSKKTRFPEEMPEKVIEIELPEEELICPDTGKQREFIRWEETIKYKYVPGHFERIRIRRAVYAVPNDDSNESDLSSQPVVTAPMPAQYRVIPGCLAACSLLVFLMVSKYCDHLPFYRIQQMFKRRHKVELDRTLMCHWMKRCAGLLAILYEALRMELLSGNYLQIDETFINLLDPDSEIRYVLANKSVFRLKEDLGTEPKFWYFRDD